MEDSKKVGIVNLANDLTRGVVPAQFSAASTSDKLREQLIEANGGSTVIDYKNFRRNKVEIFEIIEQLIPTITEEGLKGDEFFMNLVEERNLAEGDKDEFVVEENSQFIVARIADGIARARRQRIGETRTLSVGTEWYNVTIYEEFSRFMAGRIDWSKLVAKVGDAFKQFVLNQCFTLFSGISASTPGLSNVYVQAGTYDEDKILTIVSHVEAATGKEAVILGTAAALRKCTTANAASNAAKDDLYNLGWYGKLAGIPMVRVRQRHQVGSTNFVFKNDEIYILASDDKPIKYVREGSGLIVDDTSGTNADRSLTYSYSEKMGFGLIVNGPLGKYTIQ